MTPSARLALAKDRTRKVVDHLRVCIELHEANAIVLYAPTLAQQIPTSHAAHAFNQFQYSMYGFEIIRLCAIWDRTEQSVPTIIALIDDPGVRNALDEEIRAHWTSGIHQDRKDIEELMRRLENSRAEEQADKTKRHLQDSIEKAKFVKNSDKLRSVINIRHKHLAHSLTRTWLEETGCVYPMKYGDEHWLLEVTIEIVDGLHISLNGAGFDWDDARQIARKNAEALWNSCTFGITY